MARPDRTVRQLKRNRRRFVAGTAMLQGMCWAYPDAPSFGHAYEEIFQRGSYAFSCDKPSPLILDCGANVGLATIFWKRAWPAARIVAVEADPAIFEYLRRNVAAAGCTGVTLLNKAVWNTAGLVPFEQEGADAGCVGLESSAVAGCVVEVPAITLPELVGEDRIDLLKIDIEGAECEALIGQHQCLLGVDRVFVEYHSFAGRPQRLDELLATLRTAGFRAHLHCPLTSPQPFLRRVVNQSMDMRLNIFAWRE
jgi:FkbM family methyltransferase